MNWESVPAATLNHAGLLLVLVGANFMGPLLSCSTQRALSSQWVRHIFAYLMLAILVVSVTEFDYESDWIVPMVLLMSAIGYIGFLLLIKCHRYFLLPAIGSLVALILVRAELNYQVSKGVPTNLQTVQNGLVILTALLIVTGFIFYVYQQKRDKGKTFQWSRFFLANSCSHLRT